MTGETLVLEAKDEAGEDVRVTAYCRHELTPESRREVIAEMFKELHLNERADWSLMEVD